MLQGRLGAYEIERELGAGGMGCVYSAVVAGRAPGLEAGTRVALKVVHPHLLETEGFFMRFMREAALGSSIRHGNVVRTHLCDQLVVDGTPHAYLVMEYVEGRTLRDLLNEAEKVPEGLCRHVAREICDGLCAIHAAGVVHRDLKPENVLITAEHDVKIMDLGVARLADEAMRLSQSGAFVGSVEYAAPEQFAGGVVDGRADLHALGLILYELASGQHPFRADGFRTVMKKVCEDAPRRLGEIHPQLSPFYEELVHTLLAKSADDRFASAEELGTVLAAGEESEWWLERARALRAASQRPLRRIRIPRETAVYGRDAELARLRGLYERAAAGDGQVVVLEGEAGIGKSRLVDELVSRLQADGEDVDFLFGSYPPGGAASAAGAFSTAFREHLGEAGSAAHLEHTPLLVPSFDALLRGDATPTGAQPLTKDSLATCFTNVTRSLSRNRPTIVLIDDLHFAPEEARALFSAIALGIADSRAMLIGTTRPGSDEEWHAGLSRLDHATHVTLDRLGPKDLALLLSDTFQSDLLAQQLGHQVALKSDGNPFFVFEIIRGLREGKFITQTDDGTWASTRVIQDIEIPSSVLDLVNARVADLGDEERNLLDVAACWGYEFDASLVGEALGLRRLPVLQTMAKIEKRDRLVRSSGRLFAFDHHQVQESLYGALPAMLREEYHFALAEALEARSKAAAADVGELGGGLCVELCEHFLKGAQADRSIRYLVPAGRHLEGSYLYADAARLLEAALAAKGALEGKERAEALLRLAGVLERLGRGERQRSVLDEAVTLADAQDDVGLQARAHRLLGHHLERAMEHADARSELVRAIELAQAAGDLGTEAHGNNCLGQVFGNMERHEEAVAAFERVHELFSQAGDRDGIVLASANLGAVLRAGPDRERARSLLQEAIDIARADGNHEGELYAGLHIALIHERLGEFTLARGHAERSLEIAGQIAARYATVPVSLALARIALAQCRVRDALEHAERGAAAATAFSDPFLAHSCASVRGRLDALLGRTEAALGNLESAPASQAAMGAREGEAAARATLAALHRDAGDLPSAVREAESAIELMTDADGLSARSVRLTAASVLVSGGEVERGRAVLEAVRDGTDPSADPRLAGLVRCELACLPGGDVEDAVSWVRDNADRLGHEDRTRARLLLWSATGDRVHLEEAKRLLDEWLAAAPSNARPAMRRNVHGNREILAAWREHTGEDEPHDADDRPPTESVTRAG